MRGEGSVCGAGRQRYSPTAGPLLPRRLLTSPLATPQGGEEVDEDVMALEVTELVRRTRCTQCLVWAKSDAVVLGVKELAPKQHVGYVVMNETAAARAAGMGALMRLPAAEVIALHYGMASPAVVATARAGGKRVHAWTCNTAGMMRAAMDAGVDALVTNYPRRVVEALEARRAACAARRRRLQQQQQGAS